MKYAHPRWTRVSIVPSIAVLLEPTVAELNAGTDIHDDLLLDGGLNVARADATIDRTPWAGPIAVEAPTRYAPTVDLVGLRRTTAETLWNLCVYRGSGILVVRRGIPRVTVWAADQRVEAMRFRFGKRNTLGTDNGAVKFAVHLSVTEDEDNATVQA